MTGNGFNPIEKIRRRWSAYRFAGKILLSLAGGSLAWGSTTWASFSTGTQLLAFAVAAAAVFFLTKRSRRSAEEVCRLLNNTYPELEDSAALLLKPVVALSLLERMQLARIDDALAKIAEPPVLKNQLRKPAVIFALGILTASALASAPRVQLAGRPTSSAPGSRQQAKPVLPPEVTGVTIRIVPPKHTRLPEREQHELDLNVESGSTVFWEIRTNREVRSVRLVLNDERSLETTPSSKGRTKTTSATITAPGYYQISINGTTSDLYKIEVIPDRPPAIRINNPKQYTTIDFGQPQRSSVSIELADDYGLTSAQISATVASGAGEGVKFHEQKIPLNISFANQPRSASATRLIDLQKLGMAPGDELYFYVEATDNRAQHSRTEMYFISIADTAALMEMDASMNGVSPVPEYFRSQRQIIIDTEKLLKDKPSIATTDFNNRSNNTGIDQHLLRLRYSKFLGEENEGEDHHGDEFNEEGSSLVPFGDTKAIQDKMAHHHDNAEDATFFEPKQKQQLKNVLSEMWSAEMQLRTFHPEKALPFEYKALRLLKELQQDSRTYVAKTSFKTPALKPEKRLSGELDKIVEATAFRKFGETDTRISAFAATAPILEELRTGAFPGNASLTILRNAAAELAAAASAQPDAYLRAAWGMRKIVNGLRQGRIDRTEIGPVLAAIQRLLPQAYAFPQAAAKGDQSGLADSYFRTLSRQK